MGEVSGLPADGIGRRTLSRQSGERLALAASWAETLASRDDDVVLLSGSAGLGIADDHSDIDLFVFSDDVLEVGSDNSALRDFGLHRMFAARTLRGGCSDVMPMAASSWTSSTCRGKQWCGRWTTSC